MKLSHSDMSPGTRENEVFTNPYHQISRPNVINIPAKEEPLPRRQFTEIVNMNSVRKLDDVLVGIVLTEDRGLAKVLSPSTDSSRCLVLGTVCIEDVKLKLDELRKIMSSELPTLPGSFSFLTKEGWPIQKKQEALLNCSTVINDRSIISIKKQFDKQKVGIVISGGDPVGFVFADMGCDLRQLREIVEQQLKMSQYLKMEYRFIEKNGWPVMHTQENLLSLSDVMVGQVVYIQNYEKNEQSRPVRPTSIPLTSSNTPSTESKTPVNPEVVDNGPNYRKISFKLGKSNNPRPSSKEKKESQRRGKLTKDDVDTAKPILISYVRAEAAQYALDLKKDLVNRGFSVYLDVHEIKIASDWQDSLNFAVTNCFLFVPLITPMYGKTQWTNREVKLADVLGKLIVPVNFLDHWPPACLAIQFASTQYIPWKTQDSDHVKGESEKVSDPRVWPRAHMERVAIQIAECYRDHTESLKYQPGIRELITPKMVPAVCATRSEAPMYSPTLSFDEHLDEKKHSIVISAHPMQRQLAKELKNIFESENYDVWCSTFWQESQDNLSSPCTPRDLPTIDEGEVFFNERDKELLNCIGENGKPPLTHKESEADGLGRRPLSRMMSQFTDISKPSTLSQEKLDRLRIFQHKVDQAGVVVVLVSQQYTNSTFSHQQVFYCEHRKRVVLIKCDNAQVPKWFRLLMGNDMIQKEDNPQFECVLKARVKRALNPSSSETPRDATFEAKINYLVSFLKRNIQLQDVRVYVTGSSKLQTHRAEEICRAVGTKLAKVGNISLVTNGFFGAPDITARSFYEYREYSIQSSIEYPAVMHILPITESEDLRSKSQQNPDGTFEPLSYGKTFFIGDSLKERETAVARLVDVCVVIEGGPGVVHEVEEFIWNDHFVIPIRSTGGAAGGKYGIPMKIFELPPGVDKKEWDVLSDPDASPEAVAEAVVSIIFSLKKAVSPTSTMKAPNFRIRKNAKKSKKQKTPEEEEQQTVVPDGGFFNNGTLVQPFSIDDDIQRRKYSEQDQHSETSHLTFHKRRWWHRIFRGLRR